MKIFIFLYLSALYSLNVNADVAVSDASIESFIGLSPGALDAVSTGDATEGSAIKDSFNITSGEIFSFDFIWDSDEVSGASFNDFAFYSLSLDGIGVLADTFARDNDSGSFVWTAPTSGLLTYGIGVMDLNDEVVSSFLTVSNISNGNANVVGIGDFTDNGDGSYFLSTGVDETETPTIPVPAAVWLFGSGLVGLIGLIGATKKSSKVSGLKA